MLLEQKNKLRWEPTASISVLQQRAKILASIRQFFAERHILEVDTPLMSHATVTDPHIASIPALYQAMGSSQIKTCYLQTSPEYAMKRLLAAGSGSIYQITKAFRQGEVGRLHNPEFTMLEWYRIGFDHHQLMDEMDLLLQRITGYPAAERKTYADVFMSALGINPHEASVDSLKKAAHEQSLSYEALIENTHTKDWLDWLFTQCIEPRLGLDRPCFIYDFPMTQAALAKIRYDETPPVASRFEVYFKGVELANGFHELQNQEEQRKRFEADLHYREVHQLSLLPVDELFLAALEQGLPDCSGVALGLDRLILLMLNADSIADVISFGFRSDG